LRPADPPIWQKRPDSIEKQQTQINLNNPTILKQEKPQRFPASNFVQDKTPIIKHTINAIPPKVADPLEKSSIEPTQLTKRAIMKPTQKITRETQPIISKNQDKESFFQRFAANLPKALLITSVLVLVFMGVKLLTYKSPPFFCDNDNSYRPAGCKTPCPEHGYCKNGILLV
jgi:hypothetical protein